MLTLHRRHLKGCDHVAKGWNYTLCDCPVWCDGMLDGIRITKSLGTNNWERATRRLQLMVDGNDLPPERSSPVHRLDTTVERFLAAGTARNLKPSTIASYTRTLEHLTKGLGAARNLPAITTALLDTYRSNRKIAPRTWRKELEHLRAFFAWCKDRKWIEENPAGKVRMPKISDVATLPFTADEVQKLISACDRIASDNDRETPYIRQRARALVYALLYSGLRVGDVAILRRDALDQSTGHLTLRTTKTGVPLKVLLHPDAVKALSALPAQNPAYFFWTGRGQVERCAKNMRRTIQRLGALAGVKNAHPHRFRDTFAVELLTNGADIRTVQKLLGHDSVRTTEKHYAHFVAAHQALLDSAAATLDFRPKPARPLLVRPLKNRKRNAK